MKRAVSIIIMMIFIYLSITLFPEMKNFSKKFTSDKQNLYTPKIILVTVILFAQAFQ